jgi:hypothetical protein
MQWEKPQSVEISLSCEISSYANAELSTPPSEQTETDFPQTMSRDSLRSAAK